MKSKTKVSIPYTRVTNDWLVTPIDGNNRFQSPIHGSPTGRPTGGRDSKRAFQSPIHGSPTNEIENKARQGWFVSIPYTRVTNPRANGPGFLRSIVSIPYTRVTNEDT